MRSLRTRLLLTVGTVVAVAVASVGFLSTRAAQVEFEAVLREERTEPPERDLGPLFAELEAFHREQGGWAGAEGVLSRFLSADLLALVLVDERGMSHVAADPPLDRVDVHSRPSGGVEIELARDTGPDALQAAFTVDVPDLRIGSLASIYAVPRARDDPPAVRFNRSVTRWVRWVMLGAGLLALGVTLALSGRILGPVGKLTEAARRMAGGDLTARVPVGGADEVAELSEAFNAMAARLERNETLRKQMVSDVAHELRTPLTNLQGRIEALQDELLAPTPEVLASLHEETRALGRLVEDLQELALAEAGALRLDLREVDLRTEAEVVTESLAGVPGRAAVVVALEGLPPVAADPHRVRQILRNLLANALAHTPPCGRVTIAGRAEAGVVVTEVRDTGPGIAPEHLPHVFERFYRADAARGRVTGGAGLGLAVVRQLVRLQGGSIEADSPPGEGAVFSFSLPRSTGREPG